ncbi:MAG: rod-binding protein [Bacillota bacterium]|nr:rod-binding protein [Bacillota bacterium]
MDIKSIGTTNDTLNNKLDTAKEKTIDDSFTKHLNSVLDKKDDKDDKELKKVCKEFEGILLQMMYKEMRSTVQKSDLVQEDYGQQVYQSMMDDKLVDEAANSGGMGLGDALYKLLKKKE